MKAGATRFLVLVLAGAPGVMAQTIPADPLFGDNFESGLVGFGPNLSALPAGAVASATFPAPLVLTLSDAPLLDLFVPVTSADPAALSVTGGGVVVPAGQISAVVTFDALVADAMPVIVSAKVGNARSAAVRVEAALNETDTPAEADYCALVFPPSSVVLPGRQTAPMFGRLFEMGTTAAPGAPPGWVGEVGFGPPASDPRQLANWRFFPATYNTQVGNDDEFRASFVAPPATGTYGVAYRFSGNQGGAWTYCDIDGAGSNLGLAFSTAALATLTVIAPPVDALVINEVDYDQPATDTNEYIELFNGTSSAIDLSGLAVVLLNGAVQPAAEYTRVPLSGMLPAGGFALICRDGSFGTCGDFPLSPGTLIFMFGAASNTIQNGAPDGVALINSTLDTVLDALSYEGAINTASIVGFAGPVSLVEGTPTPAIDTGSGAESLQRIPNGVDSNDASFDWAASQPTPGLPNL